MIGPWNDSQRALAAAHLLELAAYELRNRNKKRSRRYVARAKQVISSGLPFVYVDILYQSGMPADDANLAAEAIGAGKHPQDSLPDFFESKRTAAGREDPKDDWSQALMRVGVKFWVRR